MTAEHDPLREAIDIAFEAKAIAKILSVALERLAESGAHDPNELHRLSRVANACSRLTGDVASAVEDGSTELEGLRRAGASMKPNPSHKPRSDLR